MNSSYSWPTGHGEIQRCPQERPDCHQTPWLTINGGHRCQMALCLSTGPFFSLRMGALGSKGEKGEQDADRTQYRVYLKQKGVGLSHLWRQKEKFCWIATKLWKTLYFYICIFFLTQQTKADWWPKNRENFNQNGPSNFTFRLAQCGCGPWLCPLFLLLALLFLVGGNSSMC